jgi:hypothetical protein
LFPAELTNIAVFQFPAKKILAALRIVNGRINRIVTAFGEIVMFWLGIFLCIAGVMKAWLYRPHRVRLTMKTMTIRDLTALAQSAIKPEDLAGKALYKSRGNLSLCSMWALVALMGLGIGLIGWFSPEFNNPFAWAWYWKVLGAVLSFVVSVGLMIVLYLEMNTSTDLSSFAQAINLYSLWPLFAFVILLLIASLVMIVWGIVQALG